MPKTRIDMPSDTDVVRDQLISEAASHFANSEPRMAIELLQKLRECDIDETILRSTDVFFRPWIVGDKSVIASFDPKRLPGDDEIIVIYVNYPHMY